MITSTLLLGLPLEFFWKSTPRFIIALIDQKEELEKTKIKNLAVYTASYVWGNDPDKYEQEDGLVAGRDKPIDPNVLNRFFMG